jgi:hypothetical protein
MGTPSHVKSALTRRLSQQETLFASVVSDWSIVVLPVGESSQEIKIADADEKQFNNLCKEVEGVVIHCDFTREDCLDTLAINLREVKQQCSRDVRVVVFGTGEDRARVASFDEIVVSNADDMYESSFLTRGTSAPVSSCLSRRSEYSSLPREPSHECRTSSAHADDEYPSASKAHAQDVIRKFSVVDKIVE